MANSGKIILFRILRKLKLLSYLNLSTTADGIKLPLLGGVGFGNLYGSEKWMKQVLQVLLKETQGCFIDVGVNIGQTLIKVKSIYPDQDYIGFEPNPTCVFYVEKLVEINKFKNTSIIPAGISSKDEILSLNLFSEDITDASATVIDNFRPDTKVHIRKNVVVLNNQALRIQQTVGIIKIDVEGSERFVIEGLKDLIRIQRPTIIIEILSTKGDSGINPRLENQNTMLDILFGLNYVLFRILKNKKDEFDRLQSIQHIEAHFDDSLCDYLVVPAEKAEAIQSSFLSIAN